MADVSANFQQYIQNFVSSLRKLVLGIRQKAVTVGNFKSSVTSCSDKTVQNIFDVAIDIGGTLKTWQVIFDPDKPLFSPDFIFGPEDKTFFPDISQLKSFIEWDVTSADSLVYIIKELHEAYIVHQQELSLDYQQLNDSLKDLLCKFRETEVSINSKGPGTYNDVVKVVVPIVINDSSIPPYLRLDDPGNDACCLSITFNAPNLSVVTPVLEISPRIENAIGKVSNLRIPAFSASLTDYVMKIQELFTNTIDAIATRYEKRKSLLMLLLSELHGSVIECNVSTFAEVVFLVTLDGFHCLFYVVLTEQYPLEQPSLYIKSIYHIHEASSDLYRHSLTGLTYEPYASDEEKVKNCLSCLKENVTTFRMISLVGTNVH